jgi:hypothetical protein
MAQNKSITSRYYPSLADLVDKKKVPAFLHNFLFDHYDDSTPPVLIKGALSKIKELRIARKNAAIQDDILYAFGNYCAVKFIDEHGITKVKIFNRITDAIIIYKDVNGIERTMPFVDFQRMAKSTYNTSNIQVVKLNSITEQIEFPVANSNHYLVTSGAKTQFSSVKQIDIYEALYELIHNQLQN